MARFVGLDVSQKLTSICVVDDVGRRVWRGKRSGRGCEGAGRVCHIREIPWPLLLPADRVGDVGIELSRLSVPIGDHATICFDATDRDN